MSIDLSQFHEAFFEEALLCLDQAEDDLLLLEKGHASAETLDSAFRAIHSIKGSAGSLGFLQMGQLAHEFESVLDELRSSANKTGAVSYQPNDQVSVLLAALDLLRSQVGNAQRKNGDVAQGRVDALIDKLKSFLSLALMSAKLDGNPLNDSSDKDLVNDNNETKKQAALSYFKIRLIWVKLKPPRFGEAAKAIIRNAS
jgi:chemotaxis protein histidine kinase CheA